VGVLGSTRRFLRFLTLNRVLKVNDAFQTVFVPPMNTRRLSDLAIIGCLAALGAWWWFAPGKDTPKPAVAAVRAHAEEELSTPLTPDPTLTPPEPLPSPPPTPVAPVAITADPQAELGTTIPAIIQLLANQDFKTIVENLIPPDPNRTPEQMAAMAQQMAQDPRMPQKVQATIAALQSIQFATPTYNATGDQATYQPSVDPSGVPTDSPRILTFTKVNGRWYLK